LSAPSSWPPKSRTYGPTYVEWYVKVAGLGGVCTYLALELVKRHGSGSPVTMVGRFAWCNVRSSLILYANRRSGVRSAVRLGLASAWVAHGSERWSSTALLSCFEAVTVAVS
jgi:hypothetical protein